MISASYFRKYNGQQFTELTSVTQVQNLLLFGTEKCYILLKCRLNFSDENF